MSLMGSLLPLPLSIPVVVVQGHPTLGPPVRGRELCTSLVTPAWEQEKRSTPLGYLCVQVLLNPSSSVCQTPNLCDGLTRVRQVDVPLQRELSAVKPSRAGIVWLWLWGVSPRQGFAVVEEGF